MVSELIKTNVMFGSSQSSTFSFTLPTYNFPFKLDQDNYMLWKSQILPVIIGTDMEGFITHYKKSDYYLQTTFAAKYPLFVAKYTSVTKTSRY